MRVNIYCFIMTIAFMTNCFSDNNPFEKDDKLTSEEKALQWCMMGFGSSSKTSYEVVDRNDGTLEVMMVYESTFCYLFTSRYTHSEYFIKKCIQGQVYRSEQNDCKGTGSAFDYYGAQKYQWCPTNDTSCDDDQTKSPAYTACSEDTTSSKSWILTYLPKKDPAYIAYYDYLKTISDEMPSGTSDYYWSASYFPRDDTTKTDAQLLIANSNDAMYSKDTYLYVLCIEKKEN
ncbi:MAG: hypothetical protein H7A23_07225 [Leptospiraceae bacterium]|nr:hypothetical protein [Leptospiraceae bacterium]